VSQPPLLKLGLESVVNVAQVKHRSPFRYPGGKTWLVPRVRQWLSKNSNVQDFIEPFCGGAIVGLSVAFERLADHVTLVELDPQVAAVWELIINGADADVQELLRLIREFQMTRESVVEVLAGSEQDTLHVAFRTILKNRANHGGVLAQGAGLLRNGEKNKGIASRWYPATIAERIAAIRQIHHRITFVQGDGMTYIANNAQQLNSAFFIDPPYWVAGTRLYDYSELDHRRLFRMTATIASDFLMTYDDAAEIRKFAADNQFKTRKVSMSNKNHAKQQELLIGRDLSWLD